MIGQGGIGKVYRATLRTTGETVAAKFLKRRFWTDARATDAMLREAAVLARLSQPGIVSYRGCGRTEAGAAFLITEWVDGEDLAEWTRRATPTVAERVAAAASVAQALSAAHQQGILHCDLKPSNVLRGRDGVLRLTDFGFSCMLGEAIGSRPSGGTPGYLAPEQVASAFGSVGVHTDVYGLGALLFALLTGQAPTTGKDLPEVLARVLSLREAAPPSCINPLVPPSLDAIVLRCLSKEPMRRFGSMNDVAAALTVCLQDAGW